MLLRVKRELMIFMVKLLSLFIRNFNMTKEYFQLFATDDSGSEEGRE